MSVDEQIAQMTNPQDFARLCNSVFTDIYGHGFQVIDGSRSDNGNDGYVVLERRMLAMYCPIKPEQKTDAGYWRKIDSDFKKAAALRKSGSYTIDAWTFITPRKLSDNLISKMLAVGRTLGITVSHLESVFLANELYRRKHLLKGFPELQQIDLAEKIDQLTQRWAASSSESPPHIKEQQEPPVSDEPGEGQLNDLAAGIPTEEAKSELRALIYRTTDPIVEINAILTLLRWLNPGLDRREFVDFSNRAVQCSQRIGSKPVEALFRAHRASAFVWDFNTSLLTTRLTAFDFSLPFSVIAQHHLSELRELQDRWTSEIATAIELMKDGGDYDAIAGVFLVLGNTFGQLAQTYRALNDEANANDYLSGCKLYLMRAKDICAQFGDKLGAANAAFNLANQIRFHGSVTEALSLVRWTIPIAENHGDHMLLQKAKWLEHTLSTGETPDYLAGETRPWTVAVPAPTKSGT